MGTCSFTYWVIPCGRHAGLLVEIKELNDKKRRDDDSTVVAMATGNRRPLLPDLHLEYPDPALHAEIRRIVDFSTEEVCSSAEQSRKVMRLYTTLLEAMLGVPQPPPSQPDVQAQAHPQPTARSHRDEVEVNVANDNEAGSQGGPPLPSTALRPSTVSASAHGEHAEEPSTREADDELGKTESSVGAEPPRASGREAEPMEVDIKKDATAEVAVDLPVAADSDCPVGPVGEGCSQQCYSEIKWREKHTEWSDRRLSCCYCLGEPWSPSPN